MSFVAVIATHPRIISGYGFRMTGEKLLVLAGRKRSTEMERRIEAAPTGNRPDKLLGDYCIGNLTKSQEQGETDSDSLVSVPDCVCSGGENDYRRPSQIGVWWNSWWFRSYFPRSPSRQPRALRTIRKGGAQNCKHLQQVTRRVILHNAGVAFQANWPKG